MNPKKKIDGYARVVIDPIGEKCFIREIYFSSLKWRMHFDSDFLEKELLEQIDEKDVELLITFFCRSIEEEITPWDGSEYKEEYEMVTEEILEQNFKESWKKQILEQIEIFEKIEPISEELQCEIMDWEGFYEEKI